MDDPVIKEIGEKHGATCAQVDLFIYAYIQQCTCMVYAIMCRCVFPLPSIEALW